MENLEELKKKYEELGKEIERLEKEKKNKRWRAEYNKDYYFINNVLDIDGSTEDNCLIDDKRHKLMNYFATREEAQKVANKIKTYIELKQLAEELNGDEEIDWKDGTQGKYHIYYCQKEEFYTERNTINNNFGVYCLDANFKDKALEQIGEERLKELFE